MRSQPTLSLYEIVYVVRRPFMPAFGQKVYRDIRTILKMNGNTKRILDVGGRKSPYLIGIDAEVTILDLPRQSELQERLHLGLTDSLLKTVKRRRTNVKDIVLQDMTRCTLPSASFDGIVCAEVIEHVGEADLFIQQINRVLKPGGWLYLTTQNGDYIRNEPPNCNPDHRRHYTKLELIEILSRHFDEVHVSYGIKTGKYRRNGLKMSFLHPLRLVRAMACNVVNRIESSGLDDQPHGTAHLFAFARKKAENSDPA